MKNYDMHVDLWSLPNKTPANFVVLYRTTPKRREEPKEEGGGRRRIYFFRYRTSLSSPISS
jgi:hypothetical protein